MNDMADMAKDNEFLICVPGAAGCYGATIGSATETMKNILEKYPSASFKYSGISSGSVCAVFLLLSDICKIDQYDVHLKFNEIINEYGGWKYDIFSHYRNTDIWFKSIDKLIKHYVTDIDIINNNIYIGYVSVSLLDGPSYNVVSHFEDVDDLINAINVSGHIPFVLSANLFLKYKGFNCLDGGFILNRLCVANYINIHVLKNSEMQLRDRLLDPSHEKFIRLHEIGKKDISTSITKTITHGNDILALNKKIKFIWRFMSFVFLFGIYRMVKKYFTIFNQNYYRIKTLALKPLLTRHTL